MSKKSIIIILSIMIIALGGISLYSTFAYNGEVASLGDSQADFDLIYSIKKLSNNEIFILEKETKYIDITLENTYNSSVKYAMYYSFIKQPKNLNDVTIALADSSVDKLQGIIKSGEKKVVSVRITNNSTDSVDLIVGSIVGFENGKIEDLINDGEYLIK